MRPRPKLCNIHYRQRHQAISVAEHKFQGAGRSHAPRRRCAARGMLGKCPPHGVEMGKPIRDGIAEIQKCAGGCDYYAEKAERFQAPEPVARRPSKSYIAFNPLASCWPSCHGISRSGRYSASPHQG